MLVVPAVHALHVPHLVLGSVRAPNMLSELASLTYVTRQR